MVVEPRFNARDMYHNVDPQYNVNHPQAKDHFTNRLLGDSDFTGVYWSITDVMLQSMLMRYYIIGIPHGLLHLQQS